MRAALVVMVPIVLVSGCGGGGRALRRPASAHAPHRETLTYTGTSSDPASLVATASSDDADRPDYVVQATRYGKSLRLDVTGERISGAERSPFDEPDRWQIEVVASDWPAPPLRRLVNGSTRVEREPFPSATWHVSVEFSIAFAMPHAVDEVRVILRPPGGERAVITVPVAEPVAAL